MSGNYPAQILKENAVRWIKTPPLDAKDTAPSKAINDTSRIPKRQKQWWSDWSHVPTCINLDIFTVLTTVTLASQNSIFSPQIKEKN